MQKNNDVTQTKVVIELSEELIVSHDVDLCQKRKHIQQKHRIRRRKKNLLSFKRHKIVTESLDVALIQKEDHIHEHTLQHQSTEHQRSHSSPECQVETECDRDVETKPVTLTLTFQGVPVVSCQHDVIIQKEDDQYKDVLDDQCDALTTTGLGDAEDPNQFDMVVGALAYL